MKRPAIGVLAVFLIFGGIICQRMEGAVYFISSPANITGPETTINFEGYPDLTVANNLYQNQGITFSRDDGNNVVISDVGALGWTTSSGVNALATIGTTQDGFRYVPSLNVHSATPLYELGAYFGNDQTMFDPTDFTTEQLSAYGASGNLLGSVTVAANQDTFVDQFIGIRSDTPIASVQFENLTKSGTPSIDYAVVIDDLTFVPVPEPGSAALIACGLAVWLLTVRIKQVLRMLAPVQPGRKEEIFTAE